MSPNSTKTLRLLVFLCWILPAAAWAGDSSFDPCCSVPHNTQIDCDDLPYGFNPYNIPSLQSLFGVPTGNWWCTLYPWTELTPVVNLNNCDVGTITRRFEFYNPSGNWDNPYFICQQVVTINAAHNYEIRFPPDAAAYCEVPQAEDITYNELGCDLLAVSVTDLVFNISNDACYKILRKYRVINWCEYDGISGPVVVGRDEDCDGAPGDEAVWVLRRPNGRAYIDRDNNQNNNNPSAGQLDTGCGHDGIAGYWRSFIVAPGHPHYGSRGFWEYTQHIKVMDDVRPEVHFDAPAPFCSINTNIAAGCPGPVQIPFTVEEECSGQVKVKVFLFAFNQPVPLTPENDLFSDIVSGSFPNYVINGSYPIGSHTFEIHVEDGCGNTNSAAIPFQVVDCRAPAPICINGLSFNLMQAEPGVDADGDGDIDSGFMEIWATDFLVSPGNDCSGPITYSINKQGDTPDIDQTGLVLTCDDGPVVIVEIYAWDNAFNPYAVQPDGTVGGPNYDHCETYILIGNFDSGICGTPSPVAVAGFLMTETGEMLEEAEVFLAGNDTTMMMTGPDGEFEFQDLTVGDDYAIAPHKDGDDRNGLSTGDVIRLAKHLAGIDTLDSPYKLIAADIDSSGAIDQDDFEALRRLVLHVDSVLLENTSWRFVDMAYEFPDSTNPWLEPFPESMAMDNIQQDYDSLGFVAVKIGDLNGTAVASQTTQSVSGIEERAASGLFVIHAEDKLLKAGEEHAIAFYGRDIAGILGYQFTLEFDPQYLELVQIEEGVATEKNFGLRFAQEGILTVSWDKVSRQQAAIKDDQPLFTLVLRARMETKLSDRMNLSPQYVKAEAYGPAGALMGMELRFMEGSRTAKEFELYQNAPNPFREETIIGFYLPESADISLTVQDVNGRRIREIQGWYDAGQHQITFAAGELPKGQVLFYTLQVDGLRKVRKMLLMD